MPIPSTCSPSSRATKERPPAIIVPGQEVTYVSAQQSWIKDLYTFGGKSALIQPAGAQAPNA